MLLRLLVGRAGLFNSFAAYALSLRWFTPLGGRLTIVSYKWFAAAAAASFPFQFASGE